MIDSGATPCCLARRCLNASPQLRCLPRKIYRGPGVIDANGKPMSPEFTINATLVLGHPEIRVDVDFLVFDGLPYSCIISQSLLRKFTSWAICNNTHTLTGLFRKSAHAGTRAKLCRHVIDRTRRILFSYILFSSMLFSVLQSFQTSHQHKKKITKYLPREREQCALGTRLNLFNNM